MASKKIIAAYYDSGPKFSYWNGCSAGGRQAMKEAQRFPADFDGIIAGAPGLDWTGRAAQAVRVAQALEKNEAARLPPAQTQLLHRAVVAGVRRARRREGRPDRRTRRGASSIPASLQCKAPARRRRA